MTEELQAELESLALIRDQQVTLEEKRRALEAKIFPELEALGETSAETPYGKFVQKVTKSKVYEESIEDELKALDRGIKDIKESQATIKAKAENDGLVTITESISYDYKATKI